MKYLLCGFVSLFITMSIGCSTTPTKLYMGNINSDKLVTVDSVCNEQCSKLFSNHFKLENKRFGDRLTASTVYSVNDKKGSTDWRYMENVFNDKWSWGYILLLDPGEYTFVLGPSNERSIAPELYKITEKLKDGHEYYLGNYMSTKGDKMKYFHVLIDKTNQKVIHPVSDIKWKEEKLVPDMPGYFMYVPGVY